MTRSMFALFAAFGATATLLAQAPSSTAPQPRWTITTGLTRPNSAYYHQHSDSIFVSNYSGGRFNKDGKGYVTRIAANGKVLAEKWATGLNAPKGISSIGSIIWVVDIDAVLGFELGADGARLQSGVRIEGAWSLNDIATTPDGTIFVSESWRTSAPSDRPARIYMIKNGQASIFIEGDDAGSLPVALVVDGGRLIVGTVGRETKNRAGGQVLAFDLKTRARTVIATSSAVGQIQGIAPAEPGAYFVSDALSRKLFHVAPNGKVTMVVAFEHGGADIGVRPAADQRAEVGTTIFVPFSSANSVSAYDLYPFTGTNSVDALGIDHTERPSQD
jgi:hypothetical protein